MYETMKSNSNTVQNYNLYSAINCNCSCIGAFVSQTERSYRTLTCTQTAIRSPSLAFDGLQPLTY